MNVVHWFWDVNGKVRRLDECQRSTYQVEERGSFTSVDIGRLQADGGFEVDDTYVLHVGTLQDFQIALLTSLVLILDTNHRDGLTNCVCGALTGESCKRGCEVKKLRVRHGVKN